ncbi:Epoxide hydrolase a [Thalictrum thalictroides]|uniref:Epoxide hydrolase a n=1 Tax=Thalictrum thalictroides TaxID=46969 RepID=A0A7J6VDY9_THATH|nr:Epoxide hydrolase a [Thalictrum thalictroides]
MYFRERERVVVMEGKGIEHRMVTVNGIKMHIAEKGKGPVVLFLHGFPQLWYTWRHQMLSLAANGYRAVAPDLRGYGDTDAPSSFDSYTSLSIVGDLVALLDVLGQDQVFVVGHDWGAIIAWHFCLFRPDRVKALEPGEMEAEFARTGTATVLKKFLTYHNPGPVIIPRAKGFVPDEPITLPSWLSEEDVNYYATKYEQKGFTGGFNYYRALDLNWELTASWTGAQVKVPVKFIVGDQDLTYNGPGAKEFIHGGGFKKYVPFLEVVVMEGVGHFINEERADDISRHIYDFIKKF